MSELSKIAQELLDVSQAVKDVILTKLKELGHEDDDVFAKAVVSVVYLIFVGDDE